MTVTRYNKEEFAYEWLLAYPEDPVPGLVRGRCRGLGLGSRLDHEADGETRGQALGGSLALRSTVMGGILGRTRGHSELRVALCDAVAGLVLRGVEQTMHPSRAVMTGILTIDRWHTQGLHSWWRP